MTKHNTNSSGYSKSNKYNRGNQLLTEHYKEPVQKLILALLAEKIVSIEWIAGKMERTESAIRTNWLKEITND